MPRGRIKAVSAYGSLKDKEFGLEGKRFGLLQVTEAEDSGLSVGSWLAYWSESIDDSWFEMTARFDYEPPFRAKNLRDKEA
jgi:hypothetical protein